MNKFLRNIGLVVTTMGLVFSLSGCKNDTEILPDQTGLGDLVAGDNQTPGGNGTGDVAPTPSFGDDTTGGTGDLQFDLDQPSQPSFDQIPLVRDDSEPTTLYAMDGDYAYKLDPETMQPTGGPLDPVTHEPVAVIGEPPLDEETPPADEETPEETPPESLDDPFLVEGDDTPEEDNPVVIDEPDPYVSPEVKLPNTGIFLEDD